MVTTSQPPLLLPSVLSGTSQGLFKLGGLSTDRIFELDWKISRNHGSQIAVVRVEYGHNFLHDSGPADLGWWA